MSPKVTRDAGPLGSCLIQSALLPFPIIGGQRGPVGRERRGGDRPRRLPARVHRRLQPLPAHPHRLPRPGGGAGGVHQRPAVRQLERGREPADLDPDPLEQRHRRPGDRQLAGVEREGHQLALAGHHQQVPGGRVAGVDPARQHVGLDRLLPAWGAAWRRSGSRRSPGWAAGCGTAFPWPRAARPETRRRTPGGPACCTAARAARRWRGAARSPNPFRCRCGRPSPSRPRWS